MLADQRDELLRRNKECDCVNETEQPQNNKARQPVGISGRQKLLKKIIAIIHRRTARLTNKLQRLDGFGVRSVTSFSNRRSFRSGSNIGSSRSTSGVSGTCAASGP